LRRSPTSLLLFARQRLFAFGQDAITLFELTQTERMVNLRIRLGYPVGYHHVFLDKGAPTRPKLDLRQRRSRDLFALFQGAIDSFLNQIRRRPRAPIA
jgi:hypothetical protein